MQEYVLALFLALHNAAFWAGIFFIIVPVVQRLLYVVIGENTIAIVKDTEVRALTSRDSKNGPVMQRQYDVIHVEYLVKTRWSVFWIIYDILINKLWWGFWNALGRLLFGQRPNAWDDGCSVAVPSIPKVEKAHCNQLSEKKQKQGHHLEEGLLASRRTSFGLDPIELTSVRNAGSCLTKTTFLSGQEEDPNSVNSLSVSEVPQEAPQSNLGVQKSGPLLASSNENSAGNYFVNYPNADIEIGHIAARTLPDETGNLSVPIPFSAGGGVFKGAPSNTPDGTHKHDVLCTTQEKIEALKSRYCHFVCARENCSSYEEYQRCCFQRGAEGRPRRFRGTRITGDMERGVVTPMVQSGVQPLTLNSQPSILNPQPSTLNAQPSTLNSRLSAGPVSAGLRITISSENDAASQNPELAHGALVASRSSSVGYMSFLRRLVPDETPCAPIEAPGCRTEFSGHYHPRGFIGGSNFRGNYSDATWSVAERARYYLGEFVAACDAVKHRMDVAHEKFFGEYTVYYLQEAEICLKPFRSRVYGGRGEGNAWNNLEGQPGRDLPLHFRSLRDSEDTWPQDSNASSQIVPENNNRKLKAMKAFFDQDTWACSVGASVSDILLSERDSSSDSVHPGSWRSSSEEGSSSEVRRVAKTGARFVRETDVDLLICFMRSKKLLAESSKVRHTADKSTTDKSESSSRDFRSGGKKYPRIKLLDAVSHSSGSPKTRRYRNLGETSSPESVLTGEGSAQPQEEGDDSGSEEFQRFQNRSELRSVNLECAVCFQCYSQTELALRPKVLPCDHAFCVSCVHELIDVRANHRITCPMCRVVCGMHQVKTDYFLLQKVAEEQAREAASVVAPSTIEGDATSSKKSTQNMEEHTISTCHAPNRDGLEVGSVDERYGVHETSNLPGEDISRASTVECASRETERSRVVPGGSNVPEVSSIQSLDDRGKKDDDLLLRLSDLDTDNLILENGPILRIRYLPIFWYTKEFEILGLWRPRDESNSINYYASSDFEEPPTIVLFNFVMRAGTRFLRRVSRYYRGARARLEGNQSYRNFADLGNPQPSTLNPQPFADLGNASSEMEEGRSSRSFVNSETSREISISERANSLTTALVSSPQGTVATSTGTGTAGSGAQEGGDATGRAETEPSTLNPQPSTLNPQPSQEGGDATSPNPQCRGNGGIESGTVNSNNLNDNNTLCGRNDCMRCFFLCNNATDEDDFYRYCYLKTYRKLCGACRAGAPSTLNPQPSTSEAKVTDETKNRSSDAGVPTLVCGGTEKLKFVNAPLDVAYRQRPRGRRYEGIFAFAPAGRYKKSYGWYPAVATHPTGASNIDHERQSASNLAAGNETWRGTAPLLQRVENPNSIEQTTSASAVSTSSAHDVTYAAVMSRAGSAISGAIPHFDGRSGATLIDNYHASQDFSLMRDFLQHCPCPGFFMCVWVCGATLGMVMCLSMMISEHGQEPLIMLIYPGLLILLFILFPLALFVRANFKCRGEALEKSDWGCRKYLHSRVEGNRNGPRKTVPGSSLFEFSETGDFRAQMRINWFLESLGRAMNAEHNKIGFIRADEVSDTDNEVSSTLNPQPSTLSEAASRDRTDNAESSTNHSDTLPPCDSSRKTGWNDGVAATRGSESSHFQKDKESTGLESVGEVDSSERGEGSSSNSAVVNGTDAATGITNARETENSESTGRQRLRRRRRRSRRRGEEGGAISGPKYFKVLLDSDGRIPAPVVDFLSKTAEGKYSEDAFLKNQSTKGKQDVRESVCRDSRKAHEVHQATYPTLLLSARGSTADERN